MNENAPEFDPSFEGDEGPEVSEEHLPRLMLVIALLIMLLPAGIPLYFALNVGGTTAIWLLALTAGIAIVNILLVFGFWNWINTLRSES